MGGDCSKFEPNPFKAGECKNCFEKKEAHGNEAFSTESLEKVEVAGKKPNRIPKDRMSFLDNFCGRMPINPSRGAEDEAEIELINPLRISIEEENEIEEMRVEEEKIREERKKQESEAKKKEEERVQAEAEKLQNAIEKLQCQAEVKGEESEAVYNMEELKAEVEALKLRRQIEEIKEMKRKEERRKEIDVLTNLIELEKSRQTQLEIDKLLRAKEANEMKKKLRERRQQLHNERRKQELRKAIRQAEVQREKMEMLEQLNKQEEQRRQMEVEEMSLKGRMKRMKELENQIDRLKTRVVEEENLLLDVTVVDWSKPFPIHIRSKRLTASFSAAHGQNIADVIKPTTNFEDLNFLSFQTAVSPFWGTLRDTPFAKGTFRYAYYAVSLSSSARFVLKHMIDIYKDAGDELYDLKGSAAVQFLGQEIVREFNRQRPCGTPSFEMLPCDVLDWAERPSSLRKV